MSPHLPRIQRRLVRARTWLRAQTEPVTHDDLAAALDLPRHTARRVLLALEEERTAVVIGRRQGTWGRAPLLWRAR